MVFYCNRVLSEFVKKPYTVAVRTVFQRYFQLGAACGAAEKQRRNPENPDSVYPVPSSARIVVPADIRKKRDIETEKGALRECLAASFTVEATMVMAVVFFSLMALVKHAYCLHDIITGNMILEESLEQARYYAESEEENQDREARVKEEGERKGSPRLWLGDYRLDIEKMTGKLKGLATAGDWTGRIEMDRFRPGTTLRRYHALSVLGERLINDES